MQTHHTPISQLAVEAHEAARRHRCADVGPSHLLWVLCRSEEGRQAVERRAGDYTAVLHHLAHVYKERASDTQVVPVFTEAFHRALQAVDTVSNAGALDADAAIDALKVFAEGDADAGSQELVQAFMVGQLSARSVSNEGESAFDPYNATFGQAFDDGEEEGFGGEPDGDDELPDFDEEDDAGEPDGQTQAQAAAAAFQAQNQARNAALAVDPNAMAALAALRNLSQEAAKGLVEPIVGRSEEIAELRAVLERRRKPNALLVGEPGVGKTALVEGLARELLSLDASSPLAGRPLVEVEMGALMAGTRFRGDFEARMRHVIDFATESRAILFIDEAHAIMGAGGGAHSGGMDASTLLKPALARGAFSAILATTPAETRALSKDRAFSRRFQRVLVKEPSVGVTIQMLTNARAGYETHHGVTIPPDAIAFLVQAMEGAAPERRFPDKAFDALDAGAAAARRRGSTILTQEDVEAAVFSVTGTRLGRPSTGDVAAARALEANLKASVMGQDSAIANIARAVRLRILGLQTGNGCASAHLLNGPSGVGKTETAKVLARTLGVPLVRIDMSEFMEAHAVSGLIGAPPGYVGFQEDGLLIAAAEANPRMVLLLDEVEKAHPRAYDLLLQIMDDGRLTSPDGRTVSFRGTHLIMTSNIGAADAARPAIGFGRERDSDGAMREAVAAHFRPEFAERLTTVANYAPLSREVGVSLAMSALRGVVDSFASSGIVVHIGPDVAEAIVDGLPQGPISGRRIARAVETRVTDAVAMEIFEAPVGQPVSILLDGPLARLIPV
jgi:ATP-dependent Clp protease ATP-binding subunit ClpA